MENAIVKANYNKPTKQTDRQTDRQTDIDLFKQKTQHQIPIAHLNILISLQ